MYQRLALVFLLFISTTTLFGQNKQLDQLEMFYSQGHYSLVYKKSNQYLNTPDYDFSLLPTYYKAMATLHLAQNPRKYKKTKFDIDQATELLLKVKNSADGAKLFEAHSLEIKTLKKDLSSWVEDVKIQGDEQKAKRILTVINKIFDGIDILKDKEVNKEDLKIVETTNLPKERKELIEYAQKLIGTPYVYGGTTTSGFDCSGFTSYVMHSKNIQLPRRSNDQYISAKKLKDKSVQPGDLVFFSNGGDVSHVGIIYSVEKDAIFMIHSSTSQGVIVTDITNSSYWTKRIKGFGTFL